MEKSQIQEFYKGIKVFLTGATGFLGTLIIEKLLRDTEVEKIYILMREKKGKSVEQRKNMLFGDEIFFRVKQQDSNFLNRITVIEGDCSFKALGISTSDRSELIENVNVVFHAAATVNFDESLMVAFNINVKGTKHVIELAKEIKHLKSIIHVSTAYANCTRKFIDEKFYDHPLNYDVAQSMLEKWTGLETESYTKEILGDWPNTYTYTKALSEAYLKTEANNLPLGIFRPSMIVSTYKEPIPGWLNNLNGPMGGAAALYGGVMKVVKYNKKNLIDVVTADKCVSALIVAAWDTFEKKNNKSFNTPIYNYVTSPENPISWRETYVLPKVYETKGLTQKAIWYPILITVQSNTLELILRIFLHWIPAYFLDFVAYLMGKKPRLVSLCGKIHKYLDTTYYFQANEWTFTNKNIQVMWNKLNQLDQQLFPFSVVTVSWLQYSKTMLEGITKFIYRETNLEKALARQKRLKVIHYVTVFLLTYFAGYIVHSIILTIFNYIRAIVSL